MKIFFTADTHFGHVNIVRHDSHPFSSVDEMNETLIRNWNFTPVSLASIRQVMEGRGWKLVVSRKLILIKTFNH